jgi:hypothetical protein
MTLVSGSSLFDRLCLGAWTDHGERTGGFYACNRYETAKQEGVVSGHALSYVLPGRHFFGSIWKFSGALIHPFSFGNGIPR